MKESSGRIRFVVLDRDGVINQDYESYIKGVDEWQAIPGSLEAIARLYHAGIRILVATNQSGLGRGYFSIEELNRMHCKMRDQVEKLGGHIEAVFFCPHLPDAGCRCRKPLPGLLEEMMLRLRIESKGLPVVGDSLRDIQAARAAGASPVLVLTGKGKMTLKENAKELDGVPVYENLFDFVDALLGDRA